MKRILMTAALMITMCNLGLGVAYACYCYGPDGRAVCRADGAGAECYHDASGKCVCKNPKGTIDDGEEIAF